MDYPVIANLFLLLFLGVADNQLIAALLPVLGGSLNKTVEAAGLLVVAYSVTAALASFISGALSDHYGRRKFLLAGVIVFTLASWISSQTRTYEELMLARTLTGFAAGTISTCSIAFAGDWFDYRVRGKAIGLVSSAYFAAPIIGVPLAGLIADHYGWRRVFLFFAAFGSVVSCLSFLLPREKVASLSPTRKLNATLHVFRSFLKRRDIVAALCVAFLVSAGLVGFITYIGQWLSDHFKIPTGGITLVFMAGGVASLVGAPLGGILADRWGKRVVSIGSNILLGLAVGLVPFLHWGAWLFLVFGATGLGAAFRQGPLTALMTEMVPTTQRGFFIALRNIASQLGIGAIALVGGILYQHSGYVAVTSLCAAMTLLVAVLLATHIVEPQPLESVPRDGRAQVSGGLNRN